MTCDNVTENRENLLVRTSIPRRVKCVFLAIITAHLLSDVFLSPMGLSVSETIRWVAYIWIGVMFSQPGLLATWAALGLARFSLRLSGAIFLVGTIVLAVTLGTRNNMSGRLDFNDLAAMLLPISQFLILFLFMSVLRRRFRWCVSRVTPTDAEIIEGRFRFSILDLLAWTTITAVLLTTGLLLLRGTEAVDADSFSWGAIGSHMAGGITLGLLSLPLTLNVAWGLGGKLRSRLLLWATALFLVELGVIVGIAVLFDPTAVAPYEAVQELGTVLLSFHVSSIATLLIVRALGYRLRKTFGSELAAYLE